MRHRSLFLALMWIAIFLGAAGAPKETYAAPLSSAQSWAYQLQDFTIDQLKSSAFDVLVIDYSFDGSSSQELSSEQVAELQSASKTVLSYFSIGEAEDYRFYFSHAWIRMRSSAPCGAARTKKAPSWLDGANKSWCGNYKTKYWLRAWQRLLFGVRSGAKKSYLDRIVDAGFDGVYLDIIDGFEYWLQKPKAKRRGSAARDMATLVTRIARYARATRGKGEFIVVPQNGANILARLTSKQRTQYLSAIDGIGAEDTFYFGNDDEDNPLDVQESLEYLREFRAAGKMVLAVDYLTDATKIADFRERACNEGFIPQVAERALHTLSSNQLVGCGSP